MDLDKEKLVSVFTTGNNEIFLVAQSLMDDAGITYSTKNAGVKGNIYNTSNSGMQILVLQKDEEEARQILNDLETEDDYESEYNEEVSEEEAIGQVQDAVKYDSGYGVKFFLVILAIAIILAVIFLIKK